MTDYPVSKRSSRKPIWREAERVRKWRGIFAVFIVIFLGFFIVNGLLKAFSFKNYVVSSRWDDNAPFVAALSSSPPAVIVFNRELSKIFVLEVPNETKLVTGDSKTPLITASQVAGSSDGVATSKILTRILGVNIDNWIILSGNRKLEQRSVEDGFLNFASWMTPFKILSEGLGGSVKTTNITRIDLLRLWWQVKGLGKDSVQVVDLGRFLSDVNGPGGIKIKSLDREALHQLVNQYFEVKNIFAASPDLAIVNSSGAIGAGQLAGEITTAEGFNVIHIDTGNSVIARCQVANQDKNPRVASYLANVFGCDIVSSSQDTGGNQIILNLGQDFAKRYF